MSGFVGSHVPWQSPRRTSCSSSPPNTLLETILPSFPFPRAPLLRAASLHIAALPSMTSLPPDPRLPGSAGALVLNRVPLVNHCRPAPACPTNLPCRPNPLEKTRLLPASICPWELLASPRPCTSAATQPAFLRLAASVSVSAAHRLLPFQRVLAQLQVLG